MVVKVEIRRTQQNPDGPINFGGCSFGAATIHYNNSYGRLQSCVMSSQKENGVLEHNSIPMEDTITFHIKHFMYCLNKEAKTETIAAKEDILYATLN